jgi:hypothetical protein
MAAYIYARSIGWDNINSDVVNEPEVKRGLA